MVTQSLFIPGRLPGLNELMRSARAGRMQSARERKAVLLRVTRAVQAAGLQRIGRAHVSFSWHEANRRRDLDNIAAGGAKVVLDALVAAKVLPDDGWDEVVGLAHHFLVSPDRPGVEVVLLGWAA